MKTNSKLFKISCISSLLFFSSISFAQQNSQQNSLAPNEIIKDSNQLIESDKEDTNQNKSESASQSESIEERYSTKSNEPVLQFSQTSVKDTAKITQLSILDKSSLDIAGVKEKDIYNFIHQFLEHANNIFYSSNMSGGRIIYGVIIKPAPESVKQYAIKNGIEPTEENLDKICKDEPTQCSLTSISNFQNGLIPQIILNQFDKDMYNKNNEIFWHNYKSPGEIKFFFEISLKNTI